jgi:hypothetical protein
VTAETASKIDRQMELNFMELKVGGLGTGGNHNFNRQQNRRRH